MNTPTTLELLQQGRDRVAQGWTRGSFVSTAQGMMYFCALGGITPSAVGGSEEVNMFWTLQADYSPQCGIPNGMQCDATRWLADAIGILAPEFTRERVHTAKLAWERASRQDRKTHYYAVTTQPRWTIDHPVIVDWNDCPGRTQAHVVLMYDLAIKLYCEAAEATAGLVAVRSVVEEELVIAGD